LANFPEGAPQGNFVVTLKGATMPTSELTAQIRALTAKDAGDVETTVHGQIRTRTVLSGAEMQFVLRTQYQWTIHRDWLAIELRAQICAT
jgi:hypothetical protein